MAKPADARTRPARPLRPRTSLTKLASATQARQDDLRRLVSLGPHTFRGQPWDEAAFSSNPDAAASARWSRWEYRLLRYAVYWSIYEQNLYREVNLFAAEMKDDRELYSAVRTVVSPGYRIGEFWPEHIYSGTLDPELGDGSKVPTSLPIVTEDEDLRAVIAEVARVSNLSQMLPLYTRYGTVCGDVGLAVVDDPDRQQVYLKAIHPRTVRECERDPRGNVKSYVLTEARDDPRLPLQLAARSARVLYEMVAVRVGEAVIYSTYLNDEAYDWNRPYDSNEDMSEGSTWTEEYGFVPFVFVQHRDMGLGYGWSEYHPTLGKILELDDLASKGNDQIAKLTNTPWAFFGTSPADIEITYPNAVNSTNRTGDPARNHVPALFISNPNAKAQALVASMDLAAVLANRQDLLANIEKDHDELQADMATSAGDASGRALRVAREKVQARVITRRAGYDDGLRRALQMAISMGAQKGYPGFQKFTADSFARGELEFSIGPRPVFGIDKMALLEESGARADVLKKYTDATVPLLTAMAFAGFCEEEIDAARAERDAENRARTARVAATIASRFPETPEEPPPPDEEGEPEGPADPDAQEPGPGGPVSGDRAPGSVGTGA